MATRPNCPARKPEVPGRSSFTRNVRLFGSAAGAISLRQAYECWKAGADPVQWAKSHREFARAFESFPGDADQLYPGWRQHLGV